MNTQNTQQHKLAAHIGLVIAMIIWGSSFVALKVAIADMPAMWVIFLRMAVSLGLFALLWLIVKPSLNYQRGDWKLLAGMALFEPCLYFIFEALALQYTSAGQAGMITSMLPILIAITALLFLGERNSRKQWLGFITAVVGVLLMSLSGEDSEQAPNALLGNFLEFLAMCTAAGYTLLIKKLSERYSAFVLTATQSLIGSIFFLPLALASEWPESVSDQTLWSILYLGVIVSIGAYGLYNFGLGHVKASVAGAYINLIPIASLAISIWLLGEVLSSIQLLAIGIIFIGVFLSKEQSSKEQSGAEPLQEQQDPAAS